MQIVGRRFTHAEFKAYLDSLAISDWARFITVHNTSSPDIRLYRDDWMKRPATKWTPEIWMKNLVSYYAGMGWKGCPHLFIPPAEDQILVLNALTVPGTHTPSWNSFAIGIETVGEFEREPFDGPTRDNLVFALAALHDKLKLRPTPYALGKFGLHFHKEDSRTTHRTCPGKNMNKDALVRAVMEAMGQSMPAPEPDHHDVPLSSQTADTGGMSVQELTSVKWLQLQLNAWNSKAGTTHFAPLTVDGTRGPKTTNATRVFQNVNNLVVDGIAGPVTRSLLKKLTA